MQVNKGLVISLRLRPWSVYVFVSVIRLMR